MFVALWLSLLNQPLYLRSIGHLEKHLNLLEVIINDVESKLSVSDKFGPSFTWQPSGPQVSISDAEINTNSSGVSGVGITSSKVDDSSKPSAFGSHRECDAHSVLLSLPQSELRLLCSLLAWEGDYCQKVLFCRPNYNGFKHLWVVIIFIWPN